MRQVGGGRRGGQGGEGSESYRTCGPRRAAGSDGPGCISGHTGATIVPPPGLLQGLSERLADSEHPAVLSRLRPCL